MAHERRRVSSCSCNWSTHTYPTSQGPSFVLVNYLARLGLLLAQGMAGQGRAWPMRQQKCTRHALLGLLLLRICKENHRTSFIHMYACVCVWVSWLPAGALAGCTSAAAPESQYIDRITFITKRGKPQLKPQIAYIRLQLHTALYRCVCVFVYVYV